MTNYFSHDYSARNDIKLQNLVMEMNYEGLGFFWCIVEMLYEQGGKIELSQCQSIAFALRTDSEKIQQLIDIVFEKDDKYFWSESILKRLKIQKEKSKSAKISAQKRWKNEAKKGNATTYAKAMPTHSESNAIKEKKRKENINNKKEIIKKENPHTSLNGLTDDDFGEIAEKYQVPVYFVRSKYDDLVNYCGAKNKSYSNYKLALMNWVKRDALEITSKNKPRIAVMPGRAI